MSTCLLSRLAYALLLQDIFSKVDKSGEGVCVQASTLGSLEALLTFLDSDDVQIPVSGETTIAHSWFDIMATYLDVLCGSINPLLLDCTYYCP